MNSDAHLDIEALEAQVAQAQPWERLPLQRDQVAQLIAAWKRLQQERRDSGR